MVIIGATDYQDFKTILSRLPFKVEVVFTNGQSSPPLDFRAMAILHEWKFAVKCQGTQNPTPPPGFIKPPTFDTDFPNAISLGELPTFSETLP
jgi:hypothetical protein